MGSMLLVRATEWIFEQLQSYRHYLLYYLTLILEYEEFIICIVDRMYHRIV